MNIVEEKIFLHPSPAAEERCTMSNGYMGILIPDKWDLPAFLPGVQVQRRQPMSTRAMMWLSGWPRRLVLRTPSFSTRVHPDNSSRPKHKRGGGAGPSTNAPASGASADDLGERTPSEDSTAMENERLLLPFMLTPSAAAYGVNQEDWQWKARYYLRASQDPSMNYRVPQGGNKLCRVCGKGIDRHHASCVGD